MLGLVEPMMCGIGGDLFAIVWDAAERELAGLNASGRAPELMTLRYFEEAGLKEVPLYGPLPISVPGAVDGWFELHERYGRLPMAELLAPAIAYAREGFPVSEVIARMFQDAAEEFADSPGYAEVYMPGGRAPEKGDIFRNPALAASYERIATGGRAAFYEGVIAEELGGYMIEHGGLLRAPDLAAHESEWVAPVATNYRGYDVYELPPNGQGIAALQMLNILEGYDLAALGFGSAEYIHLLVEAKKLAYEDRARFYADPDFADVPLRWLISKDYAGERRALISSRQAARRYPAGTPPPEAGDTVYLSVADKDGNMVSLIQSIYSSMGSGMVPPRLGFALQNRANSFSLDPTHANAVAPGKRPFHTIIPAFVMKDGAPWLSFGVMGGSIQPQGHVQILVNMIDFGMNLQEAGDAARVRHTGSSQPSGERMRDGGKLHLESGFAAETVRALEALGHDIEPLPGGFGGYQAVMRDADKGVYYGASEVRKDGQAAGY